VRELVEHRWQPKSLIQLFQMGSSIFATIPCAALISAVAATSCPSYTTQRPLTVTVRSMTKQ
jgi:hypothetical protein